MKKVSVSLSPNKMLAYVSARIDEPLASDTIEKLIYVALDQRNVQFGIQKKLVHSIVNEIKEKGYIRDAIVAIGEYPKPAKTSHLIFNVPIYSESEFNSEHIKDIHQPVHFFDLQNIIPSPYIVGINEHIGKLNTQEVKSDGYDVLGNVVEFNSEQTVPEELGDGFSSEYNSGNIIALYQGITIQRDTIIYLLPINLDGVLSLNVSEDRLCAYLQATPSSPQGKPISEEDIRTCLAERGIKYGIDDNAIKEIVEKLVSMYARVKDYPIAQGKPPVAGKDGWVKYLVDLSFSHKPLITEDGKADYFSIHMFENVVKKQKLAQIIQPEIGTPGIDVFGEEIKAPNGKKALFCLGKNVDLVESDPTMVITLETGHVYLTRETLQVEEVLQIKTDVCFETGNIIFDGDVVISGDVRSGFSISAGGSIQVKGVVEDAFLEAGNSVVIHSGFIGKGKGKIKAQENVVLKHVRNQVIMARNNIYIEGEAVDSKLFSGNKIYSELRKSRITGGTAVAKNRIYAHTLGNYRNIKTAVYCGIDHFIQLILDELEKEIDILENELKIIEINKKRLLGEDTSQEHQNNIERLFSSQINELKRRHNEKMSQLRKNRKKFCAALDETEGYISVAGTVHGEVTLRIGTYLKHVHDPLTKCFFQVYDNEIIVRSL